MTCTIDLDGFEMGDGTDYPVDSEGIGGLLGNPPVRTSDVPRGHADGDVFGFDRYGPRILTIPVTVLGADPTICLTNVRALEAAWQVSDDDRSLVVAAFGEVRVFTGRPRACTVAQASLDAGAVPALLEFHVAAEVGSS